MDWNIILLFEINLFYMDKQEVKAKLQDINLNLDIFTIDEVQHLLFERIGLISEISYDYQIYSAAAIICEIQTLPNIGKVGESKSGIRIQNVMSHLGSLSKEKFLDTLNKQLEKIKDPPQKLKKKIEDVRFSYRFYKKYESTFQMLFDKLVINKQLKQSFSALFWVLYLFIKNSEIQSEDIGESKTLLILLLRDIFENILANASQEVVFEVMETTIGSIPQISQQKRQHYYAEISTKFNYFYHQRFYEHIANIEKLMGNFSFVERLLDDMSNEFVKTKCKLRHFNEIDELSFLQLKKNLTPQVFRKVVQVQDVQPISNTLNFDSSSQSDPQQVENTPIKKKVIQNNLDQGATPVSVFVRSPVSTPTWSNWKSNTGNNKQVKLGFKYSLPSETPISKKIQNQLWIKQRIQSIGQSQNKQFKNRFEQMFKQCCEQFQMQIKEKSMQIIKTYTPKCLDYQKRHKDMYNFFISNYLQIQAQSLEYFGESHFEQVKSLVSLSFEIFNYCQNCISSQYKHHRDIIGVKIRKALKPIELMQQFVAPNMPQDLKDYLKKLQKQILIIDIWQNQEGYNILCEVLNHSDKKLEEIKEIHKKILNQSEKRVEEISKPVQIEKKIIQKTKNMMRHILQNKPYLLKFNNIDQIILCCLMSCLSINQKKEEKTLHTLFKQYNSNIQFAYNSNKHGLRDNQRKEMDIVEYYNQVFLSQIQDMLDTRTSDLDQFLLTPVRITIQKLTTSSIFSNLSGSKGFKQSSGFIFNPEKPMNCKERGKKYLQFLKQNSEMKQQNQEDQEDYKSPTFGRHFSFGPSSFTKK